MGDVSILNRTRSRPRRRPRFLAADANSATVFLRSQFSLSEKRFLPATTKDKDENEYDDARQAPDHVSTPNASVAMSW
jgi:hypothetical protein